MNITFFILAILLQYKKCVCEMIELNAVAFAFSENAELYTPLTEQFNAYAKEINVDIHLNLNLQSPSNSVINVNSYASLIEQLEVKQSSKYDIIFYDTMYSRKFSPYFIDLKKYLPEQHLNLYASGIANQTCIYNGKWVGLPIYVDYDVLYSNMILLEKYQKRIPTTWDELIETAKYIIKKEKEEGNEVVGYNGLFPDYETSLCSFQEFIYSYRNSYNSPFPDYQSNEALEALNKLKQIMKEISSDHLFKASDEVTINNIISGKAIFQKYWNIPNLNENVYTRSRLPGRFDGLSGTSIGGSNIGINKFITNEKKNAAIKVLQYMTSKEIQKNNLLKKGFITAIPDLFNDTEICKMENCELYWGLQPIARPGALTDNYDQYSSKYRQYMREFLYEDSSAVEVLDNINELTKIYYISLDTSTTPEGLIILIITMVIATFMVFSLTFLFIKNTKKYYNLLNTESWLLVMLGFMLYLSAIITEYGEINNLKCELNFILISIGYTLFIVPYINQLIVNIPEKDEYARMMERHRFVVLFGYCVIDISLNLLLLNIPSFESKDKIINYGKNFRICKVTDTSGKYVILSIMLGKVFMTLILSLLLFIEWSFLETVKDIRSLTSTLYVNALTVTAIITLKFVQIKNYRNRFLIYSLITLIFTFSNYFFTYGVKILKMITNGTSYSSTNNSPIGFADLPPIKPYDSFMSEEKPKSISIKSKGSTLSSKILYYHYYKGNENEAELNYFDHSLSSVFAKRRK